MAAAQESRSNRTAAVVGGGMSGLLAARELAKAGFEVTVLEAGDSWGGCVGRHVVAGLELDSGAESFATRSSAVADLAAELGLAGNIVSPDPSGAWVQLPDGPRELPKTGILGIPASPWDPEVRRSLGLLGALRASMDAWLPAWLGTSKDVASVSSLVRARMGRRVLERLVEPVVGGVHSANPGLLDVDVVAPGLREGVRKHGSLAAAVAAQRNAGATRERVKAGSAVAGLRDGMNTLVTALVQDLESRGVHLEAGVRAEAVTRTSAGWRVSGPGRALDCEVLVVALDGPSAVSLLAAELPALASHRPAEGPDIRLVTVVLDFPELDRKPRGTGVLVAPQTPGIQAKALTHATAKWEWLAAKAGPGTHVLRLSYGRSGDAADDASDGRRDAAAADQQLLRAALDDASALLGVSITEKDVLDWDVVRWPGSLPFASVGHKHRVDVIRSICAATGNLAMVGGWLSGNGLAAVVADTPKQVRALVSRR
ncbi:protoporphyrinogen oxidase [Arthrobacter sp. R4-81]